MPSENLAGTPVSALDQLKSRTGPQHERIEAVVPLMRPDLTLDVYRRYLVRLLPYYASLEAGLALVSWPVALDYPARRKASSIEADLLALGDAAPPSLTPTLPRLESPSHAWGCLYVLEGSTLGSQILSRRVHEVLGVTPETGGAFLYGYGPETGPRWKQFGAALTELFDVHGEGDIESAVTAAEETFATLTDWLALDSASITRRR